MNNVIVSLSLFSLVIICSNIIQGITGFAGTLIAMPFLIMLVDLETAKQVLNVLGILASALILIKGYRFIQKRQLLIILFWMTIGLAIGILLYRVAPRNILLIIFPIFVLSVGIKGLVAKESKQSLLAKDSNKTTVIDVLLLVSAGIIHGLFVAGGPLLVVYATKKLAEKRTFRATLSSVWIFLNSIMLLQAIMANVITTSISKYMLISIAPMFIGVMIGNYLLIKLSQKFFMKLSYVLLILSGISLLL